MEAGDVTGNDSGVCVCLRECMGRRVEGFMCVTNTCWGAEWVGLRVSGKAWVYILLEMSIKPYLL